jgi:hypothetical protein
VSIARPAEKGRKFFNEKEKKMADTQKNLQPKKEDIEIEPLSDTVLEDVSGGAVSVTCPLASCSDAVCSSLA